MEEDPQHINRFQSIAKTQFCEQVPVQLFKSKENGLHLLIVQTDSAVVDVDVTLATPSHLDDGVALAAARLALVGAPVSPAVNFIDQVIANTSSWTTNDLITVDQTHTSFTFRSFNDSGVHYLLRTLMAALFRPELTENHFLNEIYKVTSFGEESGCMLNQLLTDELSLQKAMQNAKRKALYPDVAFLNVDPLGSCDALRHYLTLERVRQFQRRFYRPDNAFVTVVGRFAAYDLPFFADLAYEPAPTPLAPHRPLYNLDVPAAGGSATVTQPLHVEGISESGRPEVLLAFLGPNARNLTQFSAIEVMAEYMNNISQLKSKLIPLVATAIHVDYKVLPRIEVTVRFEGVPPERTGQVAKAFLRVIRAADFWDAAGLQLALSRVAHCGRAALHGPAAPEPLFRRVRHFQLYALSTRDDLALQRLLNPAALHAALARAVPDFWPRTAQQLFTDQCAVVIGRPSNSSDSRIDPWFMAQTAITCDMDKLLDPDALYEQAWHAGHDLIMNRSRTRDVAVVTRIPNRWPFLAPKRWQLDRADGPKLQPDWLKQVAQDLPVQVMPTVIHEVEQATRLEAFFVVDLTDLQPQHRPLLPLFQQLATHAGFVTPDQVLSRGDVLKEQTNDLWQLTLETTDRNDPDSHLMILTITPKVADLSLVAKWFERTLVAPLLDVAEIRATLQDLQHEASLREAWPALAARLLDQLNYPDAAPPPSPADFHTALQNQLTEEPQSVLDQLHRLKFDLLKQPLNLHLVGAQHHMRAAHKPDFADFIRLKRDHNAGLLVQDGVHPPRQPHWPRLSQSLVVPRRDEPARAHLLERAAVRAPALGERHAALALHLHYLTMRGGWLWTLFVQTGRCGALHARLRPRQQCLELRIDAAFALRRTREAIGKEINRALSSANPDLYLFDAAKQATATQVLAEYAQQPAKHVVLDDVHGHKPHEIIILRLDYKKSKELAFESLFKIVLADNPRVVVCADWNLPNENWQSHGLFRTEPRIVDLN